MELLNTLVQCNESIVYFGKCIFNAPPPVPFIFQAKKPEAFRGAVTVVRC